MRNPLNRFLILLIASCVSALGAAQESSLLERRFERLGAQVGLQSHYIDSIAFDHRGFSWIGTSEGLVRFDGVQTRTYRREEGLGSNWIRSLTVTSDGTLWIGTRGGGLSRFDPTTEEIATYRHDPADPTSLAQDSIEAMAEDPDGFLWIATSRGGLSRLDLSNRNIKPHFERFTHEEGSNYSLSDNRTRALHVDDHGTVWIGTMGGINRWQPEQPSQFEHYLHDPSRSTSLPDDEVWSVVVDRNDTLWAGMWGGGLSRLRQASSSDASADFETWTADEDNELALADSRVMVLIEGTDGTLWIGTQGGLHELTPEEQMNSSPRFLRHLHRDNASHTINGGSIHALQEDPSGDLWVGTLVGVHRLDRRFDRTTTFRFEPSRAGLSSSPITATVDREGRLWVATDDGLDRVILPSSRFEPPTIETIRLPDNLGETPRVPETHHLTRSANGDLWVGTFDGVFRLPEDQLGETSPRFENTLAALSSNAVLNTFEDSSQALWIGTYRGLHRAQRNAAGSIESLETFLHDPDDPATLSSRSAAKIGEGPPGALWVGTYTGLNRLDLASNRVTRFLPAADDPTAIRHEQIDALHYDGEGRLWVGTRGGGLCRFVPTGETFDCLGTDKGLPSDNVFAIEAGHQRRLWLGTHQGLIDFDPATGELRQVDERQGLPPGPLSLVAAAGDQLLIGAGSDLTLYPREGFPPPTQPPKVHLDELLLLNQAVLPASSSVLPRTLASTEEITLQHSDYLVAFEFTAPEFRWADRMEYRYRLSGLQNDWIETDAGERKAVYTTLPHGTYRFEVQARYPGGSWPSQPTTLTVQVEPPWWLTWWAKSIAVLTVLALAIFWPLARLRSSYAQQQLLRERVAERTSELEEANRKLAEAARIDYLTRLPNRRSFIERALDEFVSKRRTGRPLSIALGDIDNFKQINDSWGHDCGDAVLIQVAQTLAATLRERDLVARWGGEEFIFLFYDTPLEGAVNAAEALRSAVETQTITWNDQTSGRPIPITLTLGVIEVGDGQELEISTALADRALYRGKEAGKNRVSTLNDSATSSAAD